MANGDTFDKGPANLWVRLPESVPAFFGAGDIGMWVTEHTAQVLHLPINDTLTVRVSGLSREQKNGRNHASRVCHLRIEGIPDAVRGRIKDLLHFASMEQLPDPDGGTDEFFDVPPPAEKERTLMQRFAYDEGAAEGRPLFPDPKDLACSFYTPVAPANVAGSARFCRDFARAFRSRKISHHRSSGVYCSVNLSCPSCTTFVRKSAIIARQKPGAATPLATNFRSTGTVWIGPCRDN